MSFRRYQAFMRKRTGTMESLAEIKVLSVISMLSGKPPTLYYLDLAISELGAAKRMLHKAAAFREALGESEHVQVNEEAVPGNES